MPNPRVLLLVNPRSGSGEPGGLVEAAAEREIETHLLGPDEDPAEVARRSRAEVLGVAGGDGTLGPVAGVAVERGIAFFCVPAGTRNHFARDAGYDVGDPVAALDAVSGGRERLVDVGYAGGRVFLNNLSIGVYAHLVRRGLRALLGHRPVTVTLDGAPVTARVILVANNAYRLDVRAFGERERLDEGLLHLYVAHGLLRQTWDERSAERLTLGGPARVRVAVDGEPAELPTPLELRVAPQALRLLVPR